jgi:hypothetical protein
LWDKNINALPDPVGPRAIRMTQWMYSFGQSWWDEW